MVPQPVPDPRDRPSEQIPGLNGHYSMGVLREHMGRSKANEVLVLDPFQQLLAGRAKSGMRLEVIGQRVGVNENGITSDQVGEDHGSSGDDGYSSSTSIANHSSSSALPFQPSIPYGASTQFAWGSM